MEPISRRHALILGGLGTVSIVAGGAGLFWTENTGFVPSAAQRFTEPMALRSVNGALQLKLAHPNRGCRSWGLKPPVSSRLRAM